MRKVSNVFLNYASNSESVQLCSPVLGCLRCATGRSSGAHRALWWSWPLWLTSRSSPELLWVCWTSTSGWSVSTSLCRSASWIGSQTRNQRSHRLCPCWWRMFHWSPPRWTHHNLNFKKRWVSINLLPVCVHCRKNVCPYITYRQQCQGRSWQSGPAPCPDAGQPSWGRSGRYPWGPEEPSGICGSRFHWWQSFPGIHHRCPKHYLDQNHLCTHHHVHHLRGK